MAHSMKYEKFEVEEGNNDDDTDMNTAGHQQCSGAIGLIFMGFSALSFSIMSLLVHILSTSGLQIPSFELVSLRATLGIVFALSWVLSQKQNPISEPRYRKLLASRALVGCVGMTGNWYILSQLPLGDATVIIFTAPMFTLLLARCILKEKVSWKMLSLVFLSGIGVILVARPTFLGFQSDVAPTYETLPREIVVAIGLVAALASACTNILVRKLTAVPAMVTVLWLMMAAFVIATPVALCMSESKWPYESGQWMMVLAIGCLGFSGQGFKTQGLKWEQAGIGSMMRNLDLVLAFAFQVTLLGEEARAYSVIGASLTLLASIAMGWLKVKEKKRLRRETLPSVVTITENTQVVGGKRGRSEGLNVIGDREQMGGSVEVVATMHQEEKEQSSTCM